MPGVLRCVFAPLVGAGRPVSAGAVEGGPGRSGCGERGRSRTGTGLRARPSLPGRRSLRFPRVRLFAAGTPARARPADLHRLARRVRYRDGFRGRADGSAGGRRAPGRSRWLPDASGSGSNPRGARVGAAPKKPRAGDPQSHRRDGRTARTASRRQLVHCPPAAARRSVHVVHGRGSGFDVPGPRSDARGFLRGRGVQDGAAEPGRGGSRRVAHGAPRTPSTPARSRSRLRSRTARPRCGRFRWWCSSSTAATDARSPAGRSSRPSTSRVARCRPGGWNRAAARILPSTSSLPSKSRSASTFA